MATINESANERSHQLLHELYDNPHLDKDKISQRLSELRVLTRGKSLKLDQRCLEALVKFSKENQIEAQKCLSNLILNYAHLRDPLVDLYVECAGMRMAGIIDDHPEGSTETAPRRYSWEVLYYDLRIIFLLSALCPAYRNEIGDRLTDSIIRIIKIESYNIRKENSAIVIEGLKTLFNLTLNKCSNKSLIIELIQSLFVIVKTKAQVDPQSNPNHEISEQILVNLIHLLTNMPEEVYHYLTGTDVDMILQHLDNQLESFSKESFRDTVLPVLNVCTNVCKFDADTRERWFHRIIGSTEEFEKRPEEYETLRGRLVRLMTSVDVHIKDIAADFLHALCGRDTEKFITYTGFGNSAAFLSNRGLLNRAVSDRIPGHEKVLEPEMKYKELRDRLNPITGKIDEPNRSVMQDMTEEEKEYHAHELAAAITKLTNLGVVRPMQINAEGNVTEIQPDQSDDHSP